MTPHPANQPNPTPPVLTNVEEAMPAPTTLEKYGDEKGDIVAVEDVTKFPGSEDDDPNSPEAILNRYPLLRVMSEKERDVLNRRVRRRM
jgi:hypothetical protein